MDLMKMGFSLFGSERTRSFSLCDGESFPAARCLLPPGEGTPEPVAKLLAAAEKALREKGSTAAIAQWEAAKAAGISRAAYRPLEYRLTLHEKRIGVYSNWLLCFQTRRGGELLSFAPLALLTAPGFSNPLPLSFFLGGKRVREQLWVLSDEAIYPLVCRFSAPVRLPAATAPLALLECGEPISIRRLPIPPKNRKRKKKALDKPGKGVYNTCN